MTDDERDALMRLQDLASTMTQRRRDKWLQEWHATPVSRINRAPAAPPESWADVQERYRAAFYALDAEDDAHARRSDSSRGGKAARLERIRQAAQRARRR